MSKKRNNPFLEDDNAFQQASQAVEPMKREINPEPTGNRVQKVGKKSIEKGTEKYARTKNVLFNMDILIAPEYLGPLKPAVISAPLIKAAKGFSNDNDTGIQDIINIAVYQFLIRNGYINPKKKESSKEEK